jgi:hypothetical protein
LSRVPARCSFTPGNWARTRPTISITRSSRFSGENLPMQTKPSSRSAHGREIAPTLTGG